MPPKTPRHSGISLPAASTPVLPTYSFGDIVLAKVKGHPAWPARIVDPYVSPMNLRDKRKISQKNTYLVKFFKTADYAWMNAKEMSILGTPEIRAFIDNPHKKGADLKAAYQIALAPEAWEAELENYQQEYEEQQKALEVDELEPEETDGAKAVPLKSKQKRKRPSEAKAPVTSAKKRKSEARAINGSGKGSATPEAAAPVTAVKKTDKKKKEKEEVAAPPDGESIVREWRHKLQRLFLGKTPLTEEMMPEIGEVFNDIEAFEMKSEWLHSSKLAKVLKRVGVLEDSKVPLDSEYNIRARSRVLQEKWRQALGFPEDSSNRPKVMDDGQENQSDTAQNKESVAPSDPKKSGAADTDGQKASEETDRDGQKVAEATDTDDQKVAEATDTDGQKEAEVPDTDGQKVTQDSPGPDAVMPHVNGDQAHKVADDRQNPQTVDESAQQSSTGTKPVQVNGNHEENHVEDVPMAAPDHENKADEVKPSADEKEDEGEQMDCADSPEPTSVESNNDAENKDKEVASHD